ncbi:MAG: RnfABCDGE type electron transport complex subunit G [Bacteroidales bacterium]|nr:RnfABCDGE type electron transport complex subunit G [Bacteroidales bacterium]
MAKKLESTFANMVIVLTAVSLVAAISLASVYNLTKEPIAKAKLKKKLDAIANVAPAFDNDPNAEMFKLPAFEPSPGLDSLEIYPAKKAGKIVGYAVKTYTMKGFSGLIELMVGFKPDGTINNYSVLAHSETPGLGTKMVSWFKNEKKAKRCINGKNPKNTNLTVSKDGGDIDAITAATIIKSIFRCSKPSL